MRSRQTGITFIGWLFLLAPIAVVGYAGIRLVPVYLNYMKVAKVLEQTATENKGETTLSPDAVRRSIYSRWNVEGITFPDAANIAISRDGSQWALEANYEDSVPMFAGISLVVHFDKRAVVE